jgi:O-Antigen ligase
MARFIPALTLALLAAWCGTLHGGATAAGSTAAALALLAVLLILGAPWRDPLALGRAGRLLPLALWLAVALSWWASPVRRAGTVGLLLLPAFLLLPAALARCWRDEGDRRQGLRAVAAVAGAAALWSLGDQILLNAPRAAMPLGHHTLLAAWLVTVLPLAVLPARDGGRWRFLGLGAGSAAAAAILASRSLLGIATLMVEAVAGAVLLARARGRRGWTGAAVLLALAGLAALLQGPRLAEVLRGRDPSARARAVYSAAGWRGFRARPLQGWGPGSAAWTNARFLVPEPGVNPPGEAVGELHSLPVQIAYELGTVGFFLSLASLGLFVARRAGERRRAADPGLLLASLAGLGGAGVVSLGTANLAVAALPWAAATVAGGALAATRAAASSAGDRPVRLYALVALIALLPWIVAHWLYDRALAADLASRRGDAVRELATAVRLDPGFPLYRMRLALLRNDPGLALRAAEDGRDVAAVWTVAGILGQAARQPWAADALRRACEDAPLDPFPPFFAMQARIGAGPETAGAARSGARALLAAPELAAAVVWEGREELYAASLREIRAWPGVDPGWKEVFLAAAAIPPADRRGEREALALTLDTDPRESISVALFRRRPWPAQWPLVPVRRALLGRFSLPAAATLATTAPAALRPEAGVTTATPAGRRSVTEQLLRSH